MGCWFAATCAARCMGLHGRRAEGAALPWHTAGRRSVRGQVAGSRNRARHSHAQHNSETAAVRRKRRVARLPRFRSRTRDSSLCSNTCFGYDATTTAGPGEAVQGGGSSENHGCLPTATSTSTTACASTPRLTPTSASTADPSRACILMDKTHGVQASTASEVYVPAFL